MDSMLSVAKAKTPCTYSLKKRFHCFPLFIFFFGVCFVVAHNNYVQEEIVYLKHFSFVVGSFVPSTFFVLH